MCRARGVWCAECVLRARERGHLRCVDCTSGVSSRKTAVLWEHYFALRLIRECGEKACSFILTNVRNGIQPTKGQGEHSKPSSLTSDLTKYDATPEKYFCLTYKSRVHVNENRLQVAEYCCTDLLVHVSAGFGPFRPLLPEFLFTLSCTVFKHVQSVYLVPSTCHHGCGLDIISLLVLFSK